MRIRLNEIAKVLGVDSTNEVLINGIAIDSRKVLPGNLFVCLPGNNVDGHAFINAAYTNGAVAALVSKDVQDSPIPLIKIADTIKALARLASYWRSKTKAKVICITGTAGKTTLKEALASILSLMGKIACTEKNYNNQIGLPCSILAADGDEDFWIMEAGISHAGDMEELAQIIEPDLAIILNIGTGHTEGLGAKGVAWHKSRLLKYLSPKGTALISADYPELLKECSALGIQPVYFSINPHNQANNTAEMLGEGDYSIKLGIESFNIHTHFYGLHGAETSLAAATASALCGATIKDIQKGLSRIKPPEHRFNFRIQNNWHIIDDTYNANPLSMRRTLKAAADYAMRHSLPLYVILGAMGELGDEAAKEHEKLGQYLAHLNPKAIFWKGEWFRELENGYQTANGSLNIQRFESDQDFLKLWQNMGDASAGVIVFKGSRANHLENVLEHFTQYQETMDVL